MQYIGHPIVNDRLYSSDRHMTSYNSFAPVIDEDTNRMIYKDNVYLKHVQHLLKLHAFQLNIMHPIDNYPMILNTVDSYVSMNNNKALCVAPFNAISSDTVDTKLITAASNKLLSMEEIDYK